MSATFTPDSIAPPPALYLALELSWSQWKLGFSDRLGGKLWRRTVPARDLLALEEAIARARLRFALPATAPLRSCYEAGRDGFWLHRYLESRGVESRVVDSASIQVDRRQRRCKSDGLDVAHLLSMLCRWWLGDPQVWRVVRPPTPQQEDDRQVDRELRTLKQEQGSHITRIRSLLAAQGMRIAQVGADLPQVLTTLVLWDGQKWVQACAAAHQRILREYQRLQLLGQQIAALERQREQEIRRGQDLATQQAQRLLSLKGVGANGAMTYAREVGWREVQNRRQLGGLSGLCPSKYQSGAEDLDQGISKAGNRRLRTMLVQLAWMWLRWQPHSALTQWYQRRFAAGSKRLRKIGIVALARKLLIAFWRYTQSGVPPEGALLVDWRSKIRQEPAAAA